MGKFKFIDYNKPGRGVKKENVKEDFSFVNFFKIYFRKFWKFTNLNFLYMFFNFPIFFFFLGISGNFDIPFKTPAGPMFQQLNSVILHTGKTPAIVALMGFEKYGRIMESSYPSTVSYILMALGILVVLSFGFANSGLTYIMRNFSRQEHAYIWIDYISTIKKNFWQALILGILDISAMALIVYDITFFRFNTGVNFVTDMMFWLALFIGIVYFIMRFYMYIILVTFKLSIFKIIKNSFIFTFLCVKRNIVGFLGIALAIAINYLVFMYFPPLGALLPFFFTVSLVTFIASYTAYPGIKKYMIDPYYVTEEKSDDERIFKDE